MLLNMWELIQQYLRNECRSPDRIIYFGGYGVKSTIRRASLWMKFVFIAKLLTNAELIKTDSYQCWFSLIRPRTSSGDGTTKFMSLIQKEAAGPNRRPSWVIQTSSSIMNQCLIKCFEFSHVFPAIWSEEVNEFGFCQSLKQYEVCLRMIDRDELRPREPLTLALASAAKATCAVEE